MPKSISNILNFRIEAFPLTYLGIVASPGASKVSYLQSMVSYANNSIGFSNSKFLSKSWQSDFNQ